jgi:hypothetical protein
MAGALLLTGQLSAISPQHMHAWFLTILQQQSKKLRSTTVQQRPALV